MSGLRTVVRIQTADIFSTSYGDAVVPGFWYPYLVFLDESDRVFGLLRAARICLVLRISRCIIDYDDFKILKGLRKYGIDGLMQIFPIIKVRNHN